MLKKISCWPGRCRALDHNPPSNMCYEPGTYLWTCPSCGQSQQFTVAGPVFVQPQWVPPTEPHWWWDAYFTGRPVGVGSW